MKEPRIDKRVTSWLKKTEEPVYNAVKGEAMIYYYTLFMRGAITRKDLFIEAILSVRNEFIEFKSFRNVYAIFELEYRKSGVFFDEEGFKHYIANHTEIDEAGRQWLTDTYDTAKFFGPEISDEAFRRAIEMILRRQKQALFKTHVKAGWDQLRRGDFDAAETEIRKYMHDSNSLGALNQPTGMGLLGNIAIDTYKHRRADMIQVDGAQLQGFTGGGRKGLTWIIGGYTGEGKTTLAVNIAHRAVMDKRTVLWITLELPKEDMAAMFISRYARDIPGYDGVTFEDIDRRQLSEENFKKYHELSVMYAATFDNLIIHEPDSDFSLEDLEAEIDRIKSVRDLDVVVVDYLELVDPGPKMKYDQYRIQIKKVMRTARLMSRRKDFWMIVPHQISRDGKSRAVDRKKETGVPFYTTADFQESSGVEQNCAVALWIYQDETYKRNSRARIGVSKNTKGRTKTTGWDVGTEYKHWAIYEDPTLNLDEPEDE